MKKIILFAVSNIKKSKGQTLSFLFLIMLAMAMMISGAVTYTDCAENFERRFKEMNAEDGILVIQNSGFRQEMLDEIKTSEKVKEVEERNVMLTNFSCHYADGTQALQTVIRSSMDDGKLGETEIVEKADKVYGNPVYLPILFKTGGGYELGDDFKLTIGSNEYKYKVQGFFENMYLGSTSLPALGIFVNNAEYRTISEDFNGMLDAKMISFNMIDRAQSEKYVADLYSHYSETQGKNYMSIRMYYNGCKNGRTFMSEIIATIVVSFSLIVVVISLLVIRFRITNNIQEDIKSIGALKAMGYTSFDLILAYTLQFVLVAAGGIVLGFGLSLGILPSLAAALEAQSGMNWTMHINTMLISVLVLLILLVVGVTVCMTARKIRKLSAISALRNGFSSHSFRKNHFSFEKTKGSANLIFGLKSTITHIGQNTMIGLIVAVLTFITLFVYTFYYNMAVDDKAFVAAVAGEAPSVMATLDKNKADDDLAAQLADDSRVRKVLYWSRQTVNCGGNNILAYISDDFSKCDTDICYEGRNPQHANEVTIGGRWAQVANKKIGDEVTLTIGEQEKTFLIVGFVQTGNNMGYDAELTIDGMKSLVPDWKSDGINIYLKDGVDCDNYVDDVKSDYSKQLLECFSVQNLLDAQMGAYVTMASLITVIILIVTCLIITMILYLVIKTMIIRNKKGLGIEKAMGYTTWQLMIQMAFSMSPTVLIGTFCGGLLGVFCINPVFSFVLQNVGIMKMNLSIMIPYFTLICLGLVVYSFIIAVLISIRIRRISAHSLICE